MMTEIEKLRQKINEIEESSKKLENIDFNLPEVLAVSIGKIVAFYDLRNKKDIKQKILKSLNVSSNNNTIFSRKQFKNNEEIILYDIEQTGFTTKKRLKEIYGIRESSSQTIISDMVNIGKLNVRQIHPTEFGDISKCYDSRNKLYTLSDKLRSSLTKIVEDPHNTESEFSKLFNPPSLDYAKKVILFDLIKSSNDNSIISIIDIQNNCKIDAEDSSLIYQWIRNNVFTINQLLSGFNKRLVYENNNIMIFNTTKQREEIPLNITVIDDEDISKELDE